MNRVFLFLFIFCSFFSISQEVHFSHEAGFFEHPFYLKIHASDTKVLYSYQNNINKRSKIYKDSILIDKTTTIAFGLLRGDSVVKLGSNTYFIGFKTKFNVVSISVSEKALYDSITGIYVEGPNAYYDTTLKVMLNSNYSKKMERDVYVEMYNNLGERIISQDAGIRIFGGMTIYYPEKSLRFIARDIYGNSRFNANIFNSGEKPYKQFILRHSGNDYLKTRFKDVLSTTIAAKSNIDVQANNPSHLFVNSEYWGVYNIREKINEFYIDNHYNCGTEGVDMLQAYNFVEEGSGEKYDLLLQYVDENNLNDSEHYNQIKKMMDVENFANYWIHQIYFGNTDARGNIRFWRSDSLNGKFRWILYDTDLGWGNYNSNLLEDFTSPIKTKWYNPTWSTFLLRSLLNNKDFQSYFINQFSFLLSTHLSTDVVQEEINVLENKYRLEMEYHYKHRKKFQRNQGSINRWQKAVDQLNFFALKRDNVLYSQLKQKFDLNDRYLVRLNISNFKDGKVYVNNNIILSDTSELSFYVDLRVPIKIIPNVGFSYSGYEKSFIVPNSNKELDININFIPNKKSDFNVIINEIDYKNDCIEILNLENKDVDLSGWTIIDKNSNVCIISKGILPKNKFAVFHRNDTIEYIDSVVYFNIGFGISSVSEKLALYDRKGNFVDSVSYTISERKTSYIRNIPFDSIYNEKFHWENTINESIGLHNEPYLVILDQLETKRYIRNILIISLISILVIILLVFIYRKKST
ncbi:MAG: hypothetical protein CMD02_08070 [Flavobacteriales bacterium]|nr:hypothetical protein [Flavobacteriales bacterium]